MSIALNDSETTMRYASLFPAVVSRTSATMRPISVFVLGKMMDRRSSSRVTRIFNVSPYYIGESLEFSNIIDGDVQDNGQVTRGCRF